MILDNVDWNVNTLPSESLQSSFISIKQIFNIQYLIDVLIDEQILCHFDASYPFNLNGDIQQWLRYNDNLLRRIVRIAKKQKLSSQHPQISINIAEYIGCKHNYNWL